MPTYWILSFGLAAVITLVLGRLEGQPLDWFQAWLLSINLVAFGTYAFDKAIAGKGLARIPERLLLTLALVGGSIGAILAMLIFRHKIRKRSFMIRYYLTLAFQVVAALVWYGLLR